MDDKLIFIIGCVVTLFTGGGTLIHMVTNQKITEVEPPVDDREIDKR